MVMRAVVVKDFVTEAREKDVSGVTAFFFSLFAQPNPRSQMIFPLQVSATATPSALPAVISRSISRLIAAYGSSTAAAGTDRNGTRKETARATAKSFEMSPLGIMPKDHLQESTLFQL